MTQVQKEWLLSQSRLNMPDQDTPSPPPPPLPYDADDRVDMMVNDLIAEICAKDFDNEHLRELSLLSGFWARFDVTDLFAEYKQLFEQDGVAETVWQERLNQSFARAAYNFKLLKEVRWFRGPAITLELWLSLFERNSPEPAPPMVSRKRAKEMVDEHFKSVVRTEANAISLRLRKSSNNEISFKLSRLVAQKYVRDSVLIGWHRKLTLDAIAKELRRRRYTVLYDPIDACRSPLNGHMIVRLAVWPSREY